jgi:hypothetical protein
MEPISILLLAVITIPLVLLWTASLVDIGRRKDLRVWKKGGWASAVVLLPIIGVLVYITARPLRPPPGKETGGRPRVADEVAALVDAHARGDLDDRAFAAAKRTLFRL